MEKGFLMMWVYFFLGLALKFGVCRVSRKSKRRDLWRLTPVLVLLAADFLCCRWESIQAGMKHHDQGNCIGVMLYVILFFALLIPPLAGMGTGRLLYWAVFEREEKRKAGGGTGGEK